MNSSKRVLGYQLLMSTFGGLTAIFAAAFMFSSIVPATTFADDLPSASSDLDVAVSVTPVISIRTLDSTATSPISSLDFNILPSAAGTRTTQTTVVDVSTSNVSGYNLLMQSDYQNGANYTTDLVHADPTIAATTAGQIPTATTATVSATSYWNYSKSWNETLGPTGNTSDFSSSSIATSAKDNQLIPAHGTPATIRNDVDIATASSKTNIDVNINIATDKTAGSYKNRLLFTAIANPIPVDYTLTFNKNTEDTVDNLPAPITDTNVATSHAFTIPDTANMTRSGYALVGWSEDPNTRQGTGTGPDGLYVTGDTFTVIADDPSQPDYSQHGVGSATLYAVWEVAWTSTAISVPGTYLATGAVNPNRQVTIVTTLDSGVSASDLGTIGVTLGSSACTSPTLGAQSGNLTITCTAPDLLSGDYTVSVTSSKNTGTLTATNGYHVIDALVDFTRAGTYSAKIIQTGADNIVASAPNKQQSFTTVSRNRSTGTIASHGSLAGYSNLGNNQSQWYRSSLSAIMPSSGCYDIGYEIYDNGAWSAPVWLGGQYVCYDGTNITLHAL